MAEHYEKDIIYTPQELIESENTLNNHGRGIIRMFNVGKGSGQTWRIQRALVNHFSTVPPLLGLRKDHKKDINNEPTLGPKL